MWPSMAPASPRPPNRQESGRRPQMPQVVISSRTSEAEVGSGQVLDGDVWPQRSGPRRGIVDGRSVVVQPSPRGKHLSR